MKIRLNKAHFPVTTLGFGRRIGLWFQGCRIGCRSCVSRDTWDDDQGREVELAEVMLWCREVAREGLDGVTISGGEPFQQPAGLRALLDDLHAWRHQVDTPFDILCYSGLPLRRLRREHLSILDRLDAVIPEPFIDRLPMGGAWRGSANQPLIALTPLGRERYASATQTREDQRRGVQLSVCGDHVWYIGIPARGDLDRLAAAALQRGVALRGISWRA